MTQNGGQLRKMEDHPSGVIILLTPTRHDYRGIPSKFALLIPEK